jgi:DNA-binding MarR family transcriptional regulator
MSATDIADHELERLVEAWEEFLVAVRRGRARRGESDDGLSLSQYEFLRPLVSSPGLQVSQLADRFGIASATATGILDGLERSGMITRSRNATDRRAVTITLTDHGRRKVESKRRTLTRQRRKLLDTLDPAERANTERLLRHLAQTISEL